MKNKTLDITKLTDLLQIKKGNKYTRTVFEVAKHNGTQPRAVKRSREILKNRERLDKLAAYDEVVAYLRSVKIKLN